MQSGVRGEHSWARGRAHRGLAGAQGKRELPRSDGREAPARANGIYLTVRSRLSRDDFIGPLYAVCVYAVNDLRF